VARKSGSASAPEVGSRPGNPRAQEPVRARTTGDSPCPISSRPAPSSRRHPEIPGANPTRLLKLVTKRRARTETHSVCLSTAGRTGRQLARTMGVHCRIRARNPAQRVGRSRASRPACQRPLRDLAPAACRERCQVRRPTQCPPCPHSTGLVRIRPLGALQAVSRLPGRAGWGQQTRSATRLKARTNKRTLPRTRIRRAQPPIRRWSRVCRHLSAPQTWGLVRALVSVPDPVSMRTPTPVRARISVRVRAPLRARVSARAQPVKVRAHPVGRRWVRHPLPCSLPRDRQV